MSEKTSYLLSVAVFYALVFAAIGYGIYQQPVAEHRQCLERPWLDTRAPC